MESSILLSRDLLYPTGNIYEPGCVHVDILNPDKSERIPIVIEGKTDHSPLEYIDPILKIIQNDILERILVDARKNCNIYVLNREADEKSFDGKMYIKLVFNDEKVDFEGIDEPI
ncbi:MAG: hypothetical protein ACOX7R_12075 [Acetivibrionales bacterium]|jgi:hypothetical protein